MKRVYIASPYRGDRQQNEAFAKMATSYAIQQEVVPIAPICFIRRFWMMMIR